MMKSFCNGAPGRFAGLILSRIGIPHTWIEMGMTLATRYLLAFFSRI
jgi:hypothetical protein